MTQDLKLIVNQIKPDASLRLNLFIGKSVLCGGLIDEALNEAAGIFEQEFHPTLGAIEQLKEILSELNITTIPETKIISTDPFFSFQPQVLHDKDSIETFIASAAINTQLTYFHQNIEGTENKLSFGVDHNLAFALKDYFNHPEFCHFSSTFYRLAEQYSSTNETIVFAHLEPDQLFMLTTGEGKLRSYNQFDISTAADLLYYLLATCESQSMKPEKTKVIMSGEVKMDDEFHLATHEYFGKVQFFSPRFTKPKGNLGELAEHRYVHLLDPSF